MILILDRIRQYGPLAWNFAERELKTRYRRSVLGWLWSLFNPLSAVIVYSLVFSVFLRAIPPDASNGDANFALYLFSGLVPWAFFAGMMNGSMQWLDAIGELRRKVYFPPEAAIFGSGLALAVQAAIEMGVLFAALIIIGNVGPTFLLFPFILLGAGVFGLGLGFIVAVLNTRLRDMQHLIGIALNITFFLTPIVYPLSVIPVTSRGIPVRRLLELNPMFQYVSAARDSVYFLQVPSLTNTAVMVTCSIGSLWLGWWYFSKHSMDLSERL